MKDINIRRATIKDIDFLAEIIIEAEKAGTTTLPYETIFGLSEKDAKKFIVKMLEEEIDGCVLSISSYIVAEKNNKLIGGLSAWIEGSEDIPSSILKGNLLNYILPNECILKASKLNEYVRELHIEYLPNTIQIGAGYVRKKYRGENLLAKLISEQIRILKKKHPNVSAVYDDMFGCNQPAIKTDKKIGFEIIEVKVSERNDITKYLPGNSKVVMKKNI